MLDAAVARISLGLLAAALSACSSPSSSDAALERDAGTTAPETTQPSSAGAPAEMADAGMTATETPGGIGLSFVPRNVSFDTARHVEPDDTASLLQEVMKAGQADFYEFSGEADSFYEIRTDASRYSPNNVITLFDSDQQPLGENDAGSLWPGDGTDARLIARLPRTGKYFIRIEDRTTPQAAFDSPGFSLCFYHLRVRTLFADTPGVALAAASGNTDLQFEEIEGRGFRVVTLLGAFGPNTEDRFSFEGAEGRVLVGHVLQPEGLGDGLISVSDSAGLTVAEIERAVGLDAFHPPLGAGSYAVNVRGQGAETEGYYAIDLVVMPDNPREESEASNGVKSGAEPLVFEGGGRLRAYMLSHLPPGDVDYYALDVAEGASASATCEGQSAGSGVRELRAELRDAADAVLVTATEVGGANLRTEPYTFVKAGTYYLRLSSGASAPEHAIEPWARCSITMTPGF